MSTPRVVGLDLSLTATGIASSLGWTDRITSSPSPDGTLARLRDVRRRILDRIPAADLVVVESLAISRQTGQHLTRAGLWHLVMDYVDQHYEWAEVTPGTLKRYATGRGNATKDEVLLAVARRWPDWDVTGNDEADAVVLAAMGSAWLGHPTAALPTGHRSALDAVAWPDLGEEEAVINEDD